MPYFFLADRLVDLSDENITELKLPEEIAKEPKEESHKEEAAIETADEMATNSNEHHLVRLCETKENENLFLKFVFKSYRKYSATQTMQKIEKNVDMNIDGNDSLK